MRKIQLMFLVLLGSLALQVQYAIDLNISKTRLEELKLKAEQLKQDNERIRQEIESKKEEIIRTDEKTIEKKIMDVFGDYTAVRIAKAESLLNPEAIGDKHLIFQKDGKDYGMSCGLFQIRVLQGRPSCEWLLNPDNNIKYAKEIYDFYERNYGDGWLAWSTYKNGRYNDF